MTSIRENLDAEKYRRSLDGKDEKKARKEHNKKFYPNLDAKTKRTLKKARQKSDAAKGESLRKTGFLPHKTVDNRKNT